MHLQEQLLRDLVACRANPRLSKAVEAAAAAGNPDPASLPYEQLLSVLQSLPITDYSGDVSAGFSGLLEAMRRGDSPETLAALAADVCNEVGLDPCKGAQNPSAHQMQHGIGNSKGTGLSVTIKQHKQQQQLPLLVAPGSRLWWPLGDTLRTVCSPNPHTSLPHTNKHSAGISATPHRWLACTPTCVRLRLVPLHINAALPLTTGCPSQHPRRSPATG